MHIKFNIKEDQNGNMGLMFEGAPSHFDAVPIDSRYTNFNLVAHDILEHNPLKDDGSVEAEFMAIGAAMFGRGNHEQLNFDSDFASIAREAYFGTDFCIRKTTKGIKKFEPIEWLLDETKFINAIKAEFADYDLTYNEVKSFVQMAIRYCRIGARRVAKKYKNNSFDLYNTFIELVYQLRRVCKYMEEFETLHIIVKGTYLRVYTTYTDFDY